MSITLRPMRATDAVLSAIRGHGHFARCNHSGGKDRYFIGFRKLFEILAIDGYDEQTAGVAIAKLLNSKRVRWSKSRCSFVVLSGLDPSHFALCCYCNVRKRKMTKDHVIPRCFGGPNSPDNIVFCCEQCNAVKANRTPSQWAADTIRFRGGVFSRIKLLASVAVLAFVRKGATS